MKRILSLSLALLLALCLCVPALASGEPSGAPSAEPSGEPSAQPQETYPKFDEYKEYLYTTMMQDPFWQGNEANLRAGLDAATSPEDESIQNFTGSGAVDQAPAGVVFPMTYDVWYAANGGDASGEASGAAAPAGGSYSADYAGWLQYLKDYVSAVPAAQEHIDEFYAAIDAGEFYSMPGDMLFQDTFWGATAATYDEFVAAGGQMTIPDFSGVTAADAQP